MRIAFDAKRAYHNHRGLGNYSRDVIRLLTTYAPNEEYLLFASPTDRYTFPHTLWIPMLTLFWYALSQSRKECA